MSEKINIMPGASVTHPRHEGIVFAVDEFYQDYDYADRVWVKDPSGGYLNFRVSELTNV